MMLEAVFEILNSNTDVDIYLPWSTYFMLKDNIKQFQLPNNVQRIGLVPINRLSKLDDLEIKLLSERSIYEIQKYMVERGFSEELGVFLESINCTLDSKIQKLIVDKPSIESLKKFSNFLTEDNQAQAMAVYKELNPISYMFFGLYKKDPQAINQVGITSTNVNMLKEASAPQQLPYSNASAPSIHLLSQNNNYPDNNAYGDRIFPEVPKNKVSVGTSDESVVIATPVQPVTATIIMEEANDGLALNNKNESFTLQPKY